MDSRNLAVSYALKKHAQKMSKGGRCSAHGMDDCGECMAKGGMVKEEEASGYEPMPMGNHQMDDDDDDDMDDESMDEGDGIIGRILQKFSKGGRVANDTPPITEFEENNFDDLVKDDDLEGHYPGSQEIGNKQEDEDREDIISRIMRSRAKKDRMPRPA